MEEPTVRRTLDLDLTPEELWQLIATPEGWQSWLVDAADLPIRPGSTGTVVDDGIARHVRIDAVTTGHEVTFEWHADGADASSVQLEMVRLDEGHSRVVITERLSASAGTAARTSTAMRWEMRLLLLCAAALPVLARA